MKRLLFLMGILFLFSLGRAESPDRAAKKGRSFEPQESAVLSDSNVKEILARESGATESLEALRQTGAESLYEPGRAGVSDCYSRTDPRCAAVVIVDRGEKERPTIDPDPTGDITKNLASVKEGAEERFPELKEWSSAGSCRRVTKRLPSGRETRTCDVRVSEAVQEESHNCSIVLEPVTDSESVYRCQNTHFQERDVVIAVPVVPTYSTTTTLVCQEGRRDAKTESCCVFRTATTERLHEAQCVRPTLKAVKKTCRKKLRVKTQGTCERNAEQSVVISDSANLAEDAVDGCDALRIAYRCNASAQPIIWIGTNTKTGSDIDWEFASADAVIDVVKNLSGNTLHFQGETLCDESACRSTVKMSVFVNAGEKRVLSGTLKKTLFFTRFSVVSERDFWEEECE